MEKKILIVGMGNMGLSHFKSFSTKNYTFDIVEKKNNINIKYLQKNKFLKKKVFILKKIPKNKKYLLTIFATQSRERFSLLKKFFEKNKTKFLLLEKFCFLTLKQFDKFQKQFNHKSKCFVNSWGYILAKKTKIKKKLKIFEMKCYIEEYGLLANITHLLHFFNYLENKKNIKILKKNNYIIKKSKRRKYYDELLGEIAFESCNKNKLIIKTKKKTKDYMTIFINQKCPKIDYKITVKNDHQIFFYKSGKKVSQFKAPFSSKTSNIFLNNSIKGNFGYMPTFNSDYKISKTILKEIKVKIA